MNSYPIISLFLLGACAGGGSDSNLAESGATKPTFTIALEPESTTIAQGETASVLLAITPMNGFSGTVNVCMDAAPEGITLFGASIWVPQVISLTQPLVIEVSLIAPLGSTNLTLIARSGTEIAFASLNLSVVPPPPPPAPTFSVALNPSASTLTQASSTTAQLTLTPQYGFQGTVAVSFEAAPPGITIDPLPLQVFLDQPFTQTLTIAASSAAPVATLDLQLSASSDTENKTTIFALTVLDGHPGSPQLGLSFGIKTLQFSWAAVAGASLFRLFERLDPGASYVQVGGDLPATTTSLGLSVALFEHANATYLLQACNELGCVDSNEVSVSVGLSAAIGYFKASNAAAADHFGQTVALSADGSTLAVGAPDENGGAANSGAVYVYSRNGSNWTLQAYLKASNAEKDDRFGACLSLSADGSSLIVGAPEEGGGAAYHFARAGSIWNEQAYLKASNEDDGDGFGSSLALSPDGNTLVIGAPFEDGGSAGIDGDEASNAISNSGAAYLFAWIGGSWSQQAYVKASNPDSGDHFGSSVSLSADGDTLAVGADEENGGASGIDGDPNDDSAPNAGAVYAFVRTGSAWAQQAYVKASNTTPGAFFGSSVSLAADGNTLAVGARGEGGSGAAYLFVRAGSIWSQEGYLKASNAETGDGLGLSLSLSADGNTLVIGADGEDSQATALDGPQDDNSAVDSGAVYLFLRNGAIWSQLRYIKASNTGAGDHFGTSVFLSGDGKTLAIGSDDEDSNATGVGGDQSNNAAQNSGAAYLY